MNKHMQNSHIKQNGMVQPPERVMHHSGISCKSLRLLLMWDHMHFSVFIMKAVLNI